MLAASVALLALVAAVLPAQTTRDLACSLEVVRTDTLRLADGRVAFLSAEVADTAMGKTLVAGWSAFVLPPRRSGLDSAAYMALAKRYPRVLGFTIDDRGIAEPVPLMPGMQEYGILRMASAGPGGWHVVATEHLDSLGGRGDDTVRLRYGRWDGMAWRDIEDFGVDHGRAYLNEGRRLLVQAGDTLAFAYVRTRNMWTDDVVIRRRVGSGPWTLESWRAEKGMAYLDLAWDARGRQVLLYVQPDVPPGGRDRGSLFRSVRDRDRWSAPLKLLGGRDESVFEPRLVFDGKRQAIVWMGQPPDGPRSGDRLRAIRSAQPGQGLDTTRLSLADGIYFLEVVDGGLLGPLVVTRLLLEEVAAIVSPFDEANRPLIMRPIYPGFRPMLTPVPDGTVHLFRSDVFASDRVFPYVAVRDVIRRRCVSAPGVKR